MHDTTHHATAIIATKRIAAIVQPTTPPTTADELEELSERVGSVDDSEENSVKYSCDIKQKQPPNTHLSMVLSKMNTVGYYVCYIFCLPGSTICAILSHYYISYTFAYQVA